MNKNSLYWICQIGGWLFFILLESIFFDWSGGINAMLAFRLFLLFFFGVIYRSELTILDLSNWRLAVLHPAGKYIFRLVGRHQCDARVPFVPFVFLRSDLQIGTHYTGSVKLEAGCSSSCWKVYFSIGREASMRCSRSVCSFCFSSE